MSVSFHQFRVAFAKNHIVRPVTWVCGPERVFVEQVVDMIRAAVAPSEFDAVNMTAGIDPERAIWAEVEQQPMSGNRLVLVRAAEHLVQWARLDDFVRTRAQHPRTKVLLVSNLDAPMTVTHGLGRGAEQELAPHLENLRNGKGHLIECRPLTQGSAQSAVAWVQSMVPVRTVIASHLLQRSNGNIRLVRDICVKLACFEGEVTISTVNELLAQRPRDEFSEAVIQRDKKSALLAAKHISPAEYGRVIGLVDAQVEFAGLLHDMQAARATPAEIAEAAGGRRFLIPFVMPYARAYGPKRRLQIRRVLAQADQAVRAGATVGVLESLVAYI